jgi:hypothetical protein
MCCERCGELSSTESPLSRVVLTSSCFREVIPRHDARASLCTPCRLVVKTAVLRALRPVGRAAAV